MPFAEQITQPAVPKKIHAIPEQKRDHEQVLRSFFSMVESTFNAEDQQRVDQFLLKALYQGAGNMRSANEVEHAIFLISTDPALHELEIRLAAQGKPRLRDYLMTRADVLMDRYPKRLSPDESGEFKVPTEEEIAHELEKQKEIEGKQSLEARTHQHEQEPMEQRFISGMDPESLLSTETIGSFDPPIVCQANYAACVPTSRGVKILPVSESADTKPRLTESLDWKDVEPSDLVLMLPAHRLHEGVLPIPARYKFVGIINQSAVVQDPDNRNPFCTKLLSDLDDNQLTYVMRRKTKADGLDLTPFIPDPREAAYWQQRLPLTDIVREKGMTSIYRALSEMREHFSKEYLYLCDARIGAFFGRHPDELGTIVDGLRAGHCDVLAWAAAGYFRQMGHAAVVVNTEITNEHGEGFMRDCTHSRTAMLTKTGAQLYFDATSCVKTVNGYRLSEISDEEIEALEIAFTQTEDVDEKKNILRTFRRKIDAVQPMGIEATLGVANQVNRLDDQASAFEGIDFSDEDVEEYLKMAYGFSETSVSGAKRIELQKLMTALAEHGLPLWHQPIRNAQQLQQLGIFDSEITLPVIANGFFSGEFLVRAFCPAAVQAGYERMAQNDYSFFSRKIVKVDFPDRAATIRTLPDKKYLMSFPDDFDPGSLNTFGTMPEQEVAKRMLLFKSAALALRDSDVRTYLQTRFGFSDSVFQAFAEQEEPRARQDTRAKLVARTAEQFSGKRTGEDLALFKHRAKCNAQEFVVDPKEKNAAQHQLRQVLSKLQLKAERKSVSAWEKERNPFNVFKTEYNSSEHDVSQVDELESARMGKLMVRIEQPTPPDQQSAKTLHVHLDIDHSTAINPLEFSANTRVLLEELFRFIESQRITVCISSDNNDYLELSPKQRSSFDAILFRLITPRIDRQDNPTTLERSYGFQTKAGLPKNLLYLSGSQGKVNAVASLLGKKTNAYAKTFAELGLDIYPRLRMSEDDK